MASEKVICEGGQLPFKSWRETVKSQCYCTTQLDILQWLKTLFPF